MSENVLLFEEPPLQFGRGQSAADPHDGLTLFGPHSIDAPSHPKSPGYVVLGSATGISLVRQWAEAMNEPWYVADSAKHRLWPPFPGFDAAFGDKWSTKPLWAHEIDRELLLESSQKRDPHERCFSVVEMFVEGFRQMRKVDSPIGVAICIVPDEVWANCRPKSNVTRPIGDRLSRTEKKLRKGGQFNLFEDYDPEQYQLSPDFRRQIKARAMQDNIPLQIFRESTLRLSDENPFGSRGLTPVSDRMWNVSTALYYKCGGKPWRLHNGRDGVCYVGLAFRRTEESKGSACCAAQMFIDSGDGIVFLADDRPWYSEKDRQFHLSRNSATRLLNGILNTYRSLDGRPLREIFLHSRSEISDEEFRGYQAACPNDCTLVGIRVRTDRFGPRLYRTGRMPVLRGTFWQVNERCGYLYGSGFKDRIGTYDGWETPVPLKIDIQHGNSSIGCVAEDILGLTKLNYNACRLGESKPVTIKFSDAVGEILISNQSIKDYRPNFKFYI